MLNDLTEGFAHLFYPRLCMGCNKPLLKEEEILCLNCNVYNIPRTAYHHIAENETAMRFSGRIPYKKATSFAYFTNEGLLQHLLHELKYNGREDIGEYLGKQFGYDLLQTNWGSDIDGIVPVPLHPDKERLRGYNQVQKIAEGMHNALGKPVMQDILQRNRNTESQTQKNREERLNNMKDAFSVKKGSHLGAKHLLLVDDVLTTGATLEAAVLALLTVPGISISLATIGIAS